MDEMEIAGTRLLLLRGDITEQDVDAVVNAANSSLLGGGGVDGAIHRRGGPAILDECRVIRRTRYPDGMPAGHAVATTAGALPARRVVHTVGPIWQGGRSGEADVLASAYRSSLAVAAADGLHSIAFPSISTGAYGYPVESAAVVALSTVRDWLLEHRGSGIRDVRFVLFSESDLDAYRRALTTLREPAGPT
ncbi:MAG TPA: O-acetyl-ADP-ribose deacetylase [Longimicrobiales bacterium]